MIKVPVWIIISVLLLIGCESEEEWTYTDDVFKDYAQELIPLGYSQAWEYRVQAYDPISKTTNTYYKTETNTNYSQYAVDHTITVWDSLTNSWMYYGMGYLFIHEGYRYLSGTPLVYTPYHEGNEKGLLCGFYTNEKDQGRYWFKLPRKPVKPLSFQVKQTYIHTERVPIDTTWSHYWASLDTALYRVSVPAGTFDCYKLYLRNGGEVGVGGDFFDYSHNTIYLAPGVGIVKRELSTTHFQIPEDSLRMESRATYELVTFKH